MMRMVLEQWELQAAVPVNISVFRTRLMFTLQHLQKQWQVSADLLPVQKEKLWTIVRALQKGLRDADLNLGKTESPVTPVYMKSGVSQATQIIYDLRENWNIFCSVVIYPVVPRDVVMLRLIPTAAHTLEDVEYTIKAFKDIKAKVDNNEYPDTLADFNL